MTFSEGYNSGLLPFLLAIIYMIAVVFGANWWIKRRRRKRQVVSFAVTALPINTGQLAQSIGIVGHSSLAAASSMRNLQALLPPTRQDLSELEVFYSNEVIVAFRVQMIVFNYRTNLWEMDRAYLTDTKMEAECQGARVSGMSETDISLIPKCAESPGDLCASPVGHGCGFYALKEYHVATNRLRKLEPRDLVLYQMVVIPVRLSGRIVEHESGYRSQFMEIRKSYFDAMVTDRMRDLRLSPPPFGQANIWYG